MLLDDDVAVSDAVVVVVEVVAADSDGNGVAETVLPRVATGGVPDVLATEVSVAVDADTTGLALVLNVPVLDSVQVLVLDRVATSDPEIEGDCVETFELVLVGVDVMSELLLSPLDAVAVADAGKLAVDVRVGSELKLAELLALVELSVDGELGKRLALPELSELAVIVIVVEQV
jgi:hypothetical protein